MDDAQSHYTLLSLQRTTMHALKQVGSYFINTEWNQLLALSSKAVTHAPNTNWYWMQVMFQQSEFYLNYNNIFEREIKTFHGDFNSMKWD